MKQKHLIHSLLILVSMAATTQSWAKGDSIESFDMGQHTIMKVRGAKFNKQEVVIGSTFNGEVVAMDYKGKELWCTSTGPGTMNHDIWCDDVTGDNVDEILAANGNGYLYCIDSKGKVMWKFASQPAPHIPPIYSVCVVKDSSKKPYIICGGFDNYCYYLNGKGEVVKELYSKTYSKIKGWGKVRPDNFLHYPNFLRPIPQKDGSDLLAMLASNNHMQSGGQIYIMKPLSDKVHYAISKTYAGGQVSDMRVEDSNGDGVYEILLGGSTLQDVKFGRIAFTDNTYTKAVGKEGKFNGRMGGKTAYKANMFFAYYNKKGEGNYGIMGGNTIYSLDKKGGEPQFGTNICKQHITSKYTFNDIWPMRNGKMLMASSQDGGSCIYVINTDDSGWMQDYADIEPAGKIAAIKAQAVEVRKNLKKFKKPAWQREPRQVINYEGRTANMESLKNKKALISYGGHWSAYRVEKKDWRASVFGGSSYLNNNDRRAKYIMSSDECIKNNMQAFDGVPGASLWAGHGNDPLYYSLPTLKGIADYGWKHGKKPVCYVWPEMNNHDEEFAEVINKHIMPLAEHLQKTKGKIAVRTKDIFFSGTIYVPMWHRYVSGEFADVFIPEMEETTDKTQDISLAGRVGLWMAGSVDDWGVRCSRDEVSFDRSRQFASQQLANHFFRKTLYSLACGATAIHNTVMNGEHMGIYHELLDKEALYVPKREEIVSFSPVHFSMTEPNPAYLNEGGNNKWNTYFNQEKESANPVVFGHMNGSWIGGALTPWDFSTIASGVVDRRMNIIPAFPNGMVMITPVQEGALADKDAPRGKMVDKMHPIYKNILKEYITDGVDYFSADGKTKIKADKLYTQIKKDIEEGAKKIPVNIETLSGSKPGWVVVQMAPNRLRLTLVDSGYLNPTKSKVKVVFNGVTPKSMVDVLDKTEFKCSNKNGAEVEIPCGMFRFIDIELNKPFFND